MIDEICYNQVVFICYLTVMKSLILYDSKFGNTGIIAKSIGKGIPDSVVKNIDEVQPKELANFELVVFGSPTHRLRASEPTMEFLAKIRKGTLSNVKVATFDTRYADEDMPAAILKIIVKIMGESAFAAKYVAGKLRKKGAEIISDPIGFYVKEAKGPLKDGELKRAEEWGKSLV